LVITLIRLAEETGDCSYKSLSGTKPPHHYFLSASALLQTHKNSHAFSQEAKEFLKLISFH
jgi:hypothetical protein